MQVRSFHLQVRSFHSQVRSFHSQVRSLHLQVRSFHSQVRSFHSQARSFHSQVRSFHLQVRSFHLQVQKDSLLGGSPVLLVNDRFLAEDGFQSHFLRSEQLPVVHLNYGSILPPQSTGFEGLRSGFLNFAGQIVDDRSGFVDPRSSLGLVAKRLVNDRFLAEDGFQSHFLRIEWLPILVVASQTAIASFEVVALGFVAPFLGWQFGLANHPVLRLPASVDSPSPIPWPTIGFEPLLVPGLNDRPGLLNLSPLAIESSRSVPLMPTDPLTLSELAVLPVPIALRFPRR